MTTATDIPISPDVAHAAQAVPAAHYTDHEQRGRTVHRTNPVYVQRDISSMDVHPGMNVLEMGTGSGYTGALLATLTGPAGHVTSLDIDPFLVTWANLIHHQRGLDHIRCHTADGIHGWPDAAPYDRIGAWCAPPLLPRPWVNQAAEDALIVTTLPVAPVPDLAVLATIRVTHGRPQVESVTGGVYIDATPAPRADLDLPGRWVDWENRHPARSWISLAWRDRDNWLHSGARTTLARLLTPGHTEPADDIPWRRWQYWVASSGDEGTTLACLADGDDQLAFGHSTPESAAALTQNGRLIADAPDSPSLTVVRRWIAEWNDAGRPAREDYTPALVPATGPDGTGWNLRLTR